MVHKTMIMHVLFGLIIVSTILGSSQIQAGQSLTIHKEGGQFIVLEKTSRTTVFSNRSAYLSIQYAIDHAGMGGMVILARGMYELSSSVHLRKGVKLCGQGRGTELRLIKPGKVCIIMKNIKNATVSRLTVHDTIQSGYWSTGIVIDGSSNCSVLNTLILGFGQYGIHLSGKTSGCEIMRCDLTDNVSANIYIESISEGKKPTRITSCTLFWGGGGIKCDSGISLDVYSTMMHHINGIPVDVKCDNFHMSGSRLFWGESLVANVQIAGDDFDFSNNVITWSRGDGIIVDGSKGGIIKGNNITDHGAPPRDEIFKSGVVLKNGAENVMVTANAIWNWDDWTQGPMFYGVDESADCKNNTIIYNNVHFYKEGAIRALGSGTIIENNVTDPGRDDNQFLADFDVWREYIENFINNDLSITFHEEAPSQDFLVCSEGDQYNVYTSITDNKIYSSDLAQVAIQWAVDGSATYGGGVELSEGLFELEKTIILRRNVWLHGQGSLTELRAVGSMNVCVQLYDAPQAVLSDLRITAGSNVKTGIDVFGCLTTKILDVGVEGFTDYGIYFAGDPDAPPDTWYGIAGPALFLIEGCKIGNNGEANIYVSTSGGYIGNAVPTMISKNIIYGGKIGIYHQGINSNMVGNIIYHASQNAIVPNQNSILMTDNITYRIGGTAIKAFDGKDNLFSSHYDRHDNNNNKECHITNNKLIDQRGHGIEISEQWGPIVDNVIQNCGIGVGWRYGIWLHEDSESYAVVDNTIYNQKHHYPLASGIREDGRKNLIANNSIKSYKKGGVLSQGMHTLVINNKAESGSKLEKFAEWQWDGDINADWSFEELSEYIIRKVKIDD